MKHVVILYGVCGSRSSRRSVHRCFLALAGERYFSEGNNGHDGDIWAKTKLFLAYCLYITPILKELQRKVGFAPIDSNAKVGPPFPFAICRENDHVMRELTGILGPA